MKKKIVLAAMLALALALVSIFSACSTGRTDSSDFNGDSQESSSPILDDSSSDEESSSSIVDDSSSDDPIKDDCTVRFDTDGGGSIADVSVKKGEKISQPKTPTKITSQCEYVFVGWFYNGVAWDFEKDVVTEDMTLVAHWEEGDRYTDPFLPKN